LRAKIALGQIHEVIVIGQGTAAVAGQAVAGAISRSLPGVRTQAMAASELSGWGPSGNGLPDDMEGALVVAISQSGTTTDTNRTVDLVRARGATVVSIVNRRNSDLVQKSDGVLYTSDGRDVEMSVASTKAFYSQVAAGQLLAAGLADIAAPGEARRSSVLAALRDLPSLMEKVLCLRPDIAHVAASLAPARRSWAVVGSGPDRVAAAEVRIKLSELCYKAIALDTVEDKKHIDLSAEPMVLVCVPSISGPNAADAAKEVAIFRAHRAAPVVIVAEEEAALFAGQPDVVVVPRCHPELSFVLAAMVGHLFGYEAALAIDALANPLRAARSALHEAQLGSGSSISVAGGPAGSVLGQVGPALETVLQPALAGLRSGAYDGCLNASTAARLTSLIRYATGAQAVEAYEAEMGKVGTPGAIAEDLLAALAVAIDELSRPIDAIKHQAKTVTVGISRSEEDLVRSKLAAEVLAAGAPLSSLGYRALRTLAGLSPAVEEVLGYTRYLIEAAPGRAASLEGATIMVLDRGGIARDIPSRTATDHALLGTKHRAAQTREVTVFKGLHDGRTGVMVPEAKDGQVTGLTLLHARFARRLAPEAAKAVLQCYQGRYQALVDAVTEARPDFDESLLGEIPFIDLMTEPVAVLARHWTASPRS
jgi:glucosamine--fructose-6-phosphate aminotransferase (isomerizing)